MLFYALGLLAVAVVVLAIVRASKRTPHPWMLAVPAQPDWSRLDGPAPLSPKLLLAPYEMNWPIRCYDARVHKSGLRVTLGVFENPSGAESIVFLAERLLVDRTELPSSQPRPIAAGRLEVVARTGWIHVTGIEGAAAKSQGGWADQVVNINWYFAEPGTRRVHFASTFINADEGQAAFDLLHDLLRHAAFGPDTLLRVTTRELLDRA